jgi:hypothetical protein
MTAGQRSVRFSNGDQCVGRGQSWRLISRMVTSRFFASFKTSMFQSFVKRRAPGTLRITFCVQWEVQNERRLEGHGLCRQWSRVMGGELLFTVHPHLLCGLASALSRRDNLSPKNVTT